MRVQLTLISFIISAFCFSQKAEFFVKKKTITFPKTEEGKQLKYKYRIYNTGDAPLSIDSFQVECSCTKVKLPKNKIEPGDFDFVEVLFDTTGKYYFQDRKIHLTTNTKKKKHSLRFKVYVIPKKKNE